MDCIKRSLTIFLCLITSITIAQQISVDNTVPVQQLIENSLIQGCVEVSNISCFNFLRKSVCIKDLL